MPYCQNCGRPLSENEVCNCRNQNPNPAAPSPAVYDYQNGQFQQGNAQNQNAPKKNNTAVIVIIVIAVIMLFVLPVLGVLAAILVPAMIGYTVKSKQASINSTAKSLYDAYSTAIIELDSEGYDIGESPYIISSESYLNINVPFDVDVIYTKAEQYFYDIGEYTYFVVIENGRVSYAACEENDGSRIGTYPFRTEANEGPVTYSGSIGDEDWDLEDLYYYTCKEISLRP